MKQRRNRSKIPEEEERGPESHLPETHHQAVPRPEYLILYKFPFHCRKILSLKAIVEFRMSKLLV